MIVVAAVVTDASCTAHSSDTELDEGFMNLLGFAVGFLLLVFSICHISITAFTRTIRTTHVAVHTARSHTTRDMHTARYVRIIHL